MLNTSYTYYDQINFIRLGKLPPIPKELESAYKIAAKANKLGIEYCGKFILDVQKEIEAKIKSNDF